MGPGFRRDDGFRDVGGIEMTSAVKERIDRALRDAVEAREVPGIVALAASDRGVLYEGAFGIRDLDAGGAMTFGTLFRIASMPKAITPAAARHPVDQTKIALTVPGPNTIPAPPRPHLLEGSMP